MTNITVNFKKRKNILQYKWGWITIKKTMGMLYLSECHPMINCNNIFGRGREQNGCTDKQFNVYDATLFELPME